MIAINEETELLELAPVAAQTASGDSTGLDVTKFVGQGAVLFYSSAGSGTTPTLTAKLQTAAAVGGPYTDVPGGGFVQVTGATSTQKIGVDFEAVSQFLRVDYVIGGTTPSFTFGAALVGCSRRLP